MRIGLFVGKNVVHPVDGHPFGRGVLERALSEQREKVFEPLGQDEAAMRQQPVVPERDAHAVERHTEYGEGQSGPAKQPGNEGCARRKMNPDDRNDVEPDLPVAAYGGRQRQTCRCVSFQWRRRRRSDGGGGIGEGCDMKPLSLMKDRSHRSDSDFDGLGSPAPGR